MCDRCDPRPKSIYPVLWLVGIGLLALAAILQSRESRGQAVPSPQSPPPPRSSGWQSVPRGEPVPAPPPPARDEFATPPTDGPDVPVTAPPAPPTQPPAPTPPPSPTCKQNGRARTTVTRETEGASVIVDQTAPGTIIINSPGTAPGVPTAGQAPAPASYAVIPTVATVPVAAAAQPGMLRAAASYLSQRFCPARQAQPAAFLTPAVAAAPLMAVQPVQLLQAVPVQYVQAAPQLVQAAPQYVQAAPQYVPAAMPQPVYAPAAPRKCGLFGR